MWEKIVAFMAEEKILLIVIAVAIVLLVIVSVLGSIKNKKDAKLANAESPNGEDEVPLSAEAEQAEKSTDAVDKTAEPQIDNEQKLAKKSVKKTVADKEIVAEAEVKEEGVVTAEPEIQPVAEEENLSEETEDVVVDTAEEKKDVVSRPGTVEIYKGKSDFYFNFRASNNILIGRSQGYSSKEGCKSGAAAVMTAAEIATIHDSVKIKADKVYKPAFGKTVFEIYTDKEGKYRWRLFAKNQQNILASKGYTTKASAKSAVESLKKIAVNYVLEDKTK